MARRARSGDELCPSRPARVTSSSSLDFNIRVGPQARQYNPMLLLGRMQCWIVPGPHTAAPCCTSASAMAMTTPANFTAVAEQKPCCHTTQCPFGLKRREGRQHRLATSSRSALPLAIRQPPSVRCHLPWGSGHPAKQPCEAAARRRNTLHLWPAWAKKLRGENELEARAT